MRDLSDLAAHSLNASSMAATNTISSGTAMSAPGTTSESTAREPVGDPALETIAKPRSVILHGPGIELGSWNYVDGVDH